MSPGIDITVAAVIENDGRFLVVEEHAGGRLVLNQPAGHLERGESLQTAAMRETLEETGYRFSPEHLVGIYLWQSDSGASFLRVTFCGSARPSPSPPRLDDGIVAVHWLSRAQLLGRHLRSPMVLRCIDDYAAGVRYPLAALTHLEPSLAPRAQRLGA